MRNILDNEIKKEQYLSAALGAYNAGVVSEVVEKTYSPEAQKLISQIKKIDEKLDKIGFDTALKYGWGTQKLGHAQKKRDGLATEKNKLREKLYDLGIEI